MLAAAALVSAVVSLDQGSSRRDRRMALVAIGTSGVAFLLAFLTHWVAWPAAVLCL